MEENDLFFKEVKRHVDLVLNELGYRAAGTADAAEIQISVDAHLSEPLVESQNYSEPIYVETGGYHRAWRNYAAREHGV